MLRAFLVIERGNSFILHSSVRLCDEFALRCAHENDIAQLRYMAQEFTEGFNSGDVDRIMRFYEATYVDVNLRTPVQSWAERRAYYADVLQRGGFRVAVRPDDIQIHGDFAFVRGTIDLLMQVLCYYRLAIGQ